MATTAKPEAIWHLRSEHSGTFLRLQRMLDSRRSFTLCFLEYSDSAYRDLVADFLEERLGARLRVAIDPSTRIGTEALFERLAVNPTEGPAQLTGLQDWPEGIDDLLTRLNYRRGALAERCPRPLLVWVPTLHLRRLATTAADLWAWRSGVFDFSLPPDGAIRFVLNSPPIDRRVATLPRRAERVAELQQHLLGRSEWRPIDVDLALELGDLQRSVGDTEAAETSYQDAKAALSRLDDHRRTAIVEGRLADILQDRGKLDEALRIRTEEQLPVYERLGDTRAWAVTRGRIADILLARGELDEPLRIRREEELPVYERLGDARTRAITQGEIAEILRAQGQLDEALRILTEEVLPVFEEIDDIHSRAVSLGQIADIHQTRGELDEALRIRMEEELPIFERLGDRRSLAITKGLTAGIRQARGELDEALRILTEETLPVFEQLHDIRLQAITKGKVAGIHQARGELDEALRILTEEVLPVFEQLGHRSARTATYATIAEIFVARGRINEAAETYEHDVLPGLRTMAPSTEVNAVVARIKALRSRTEGSAELMPSQP